MPANFGPFANGGTLFEFTAKSTTGETEVTTARGLFLYPGMVAETVGGTQIQRDFHQV